MLKIQKLSACKQLNLGENIIAAEKENIIYPMINKVVAQKILTFKINGLKGKSKSECSFSKKEQIDITNMKKYQKIEKLQSKNIFRLKLKINPHFMHSHQNLNSKSIKKCQQQSQNTLKSLKNETSNSQKYLRRSILTFNSNTELQNKYRSISYKQNQNKMHIINVKKYFNQTKYLKLNNGTKNDLKLKIEKYNISKIIDNQN